MSIGSVHGPASDESMEAAVAAAAASPARATRGQKRKHGGESAADGRIEKTAEAAMGTTADIWGKISSFLSQGEAATVAKTGSLKAAQKQRARRKAEQQSLSAGGVVPETAAKMATGASAGPAAAVSGSSSSLTDAEKAAAAKFARSFWPEAMRGREDNLAIRFVQERIKGGATLPYTFPVPAYFNESARGHVHQLALDAIVTPAILGELYRLFPNLQSLTIAGGYMTTEPGTPITNDHLQQIAQWEGLQSLDLGDCHRVTDEGLKSLKELPQLRNVTLGNLLTATSVGFGHLTSLSALLHLHLPDSSQINDTWFDQLAACPHLLSLSLSGSMRVDTVTDAGFAKLAALTELRSLSFGKYLGVSAQGYASLAQLTQLDTLKVHSDKFDINCLRSFLPSLTRLRHLDFSRSYSGITDDILEYLATQRHLINLLESLDLSNCYGFSGTGLAHFASFTRLRDLNIGEFRQIDSALENLHLLSSVRNLNLETAQELTGKGLSSLCRCVQLEKLNLDRCRTFYNIGINLSNLAPLVNLQELTVKYCGITDADCAALKRAIKARGGSGNLKIIR